MADPDQRRAIQQHVSVHLDRYEKDHSAETFVSLSRLVGCSAGQTKRLLRRHCGTNFPLRVRRNKVYTTYAGLLRLMRAFDGPVGNQMAS